MSDTDVHNWSQSFEEPARLWRLELPDEAPDNVAIRAYDRLGLDCTDLLILARTERTQYDISISPPELIGRQVDDLVLTFVATWFGSVDDETAPEQPSGEEKPPPAVDECPGCGGPVDYEEPDPGGRPTVWCPNCTRRYAIGF